MGGGWVGSHGTQRAGGRRLGRRRRRTFRGVAVGSAVRLRKHGHEVLQIMMRAAMGQKRANLPSMQKALSRRLPWLPGYDRRDVVTVWTLFSFFAAAEAADDVRQTSMYALSFATVTQPAL